MQTRSRNWPWWRRAITGLIALALGLSSYLAWHYVAGGTVIGCGGGSPCEEVLSSRWSSIGGVLPVSGLAAGAYLAMFVACLFIGPATEPSVRRLAWRAMLVLTGAAAGSAVWFFVVQKWFIGSFCPYCMATHSIGLLLAALVLWQAPKQFISPSQRVIAKFPAFGVVSIGLTFAGVMAVLQTTITPPPVFHAGESQANLPEIQPRDAPMVGSPDAPYIVNLLFDYKCPHCQQLHFMLDEAIRRYDGKLAFALCPTPLNTNCNSYIPRNVEEFTNSCELARIALAVWKAKPEAFPAFDLWMFSMESGDRWHPRSLEAATAKAVELVGQAKLEAALADPWIERYLQSCVHLFGTTVQGNNAVPKFVFNSRWVIPKPNDADELVSILRDSLGLPAP